eukprot:SAG31_NODE_17568_length_666_cov_1.135802_1_plen_111_part_00
MSRKQIQVAGGDEAQRNRICHQRGKPCRLKPACADDREQCSPKVTSIVRPGVEEAEATHEDVDNFQAESLQQICTDGPYTVMKNTKRRWSPTQLHGTILGRIGEDAQITK